MAPEQAVGRSSGGDPRADVYALGMTLHELLTLRPAFDAPDRRSLLRQVAFDEPKALRAVDPTIPRDLETIVRKATAKAPESRYGSAEELAADLRRFLDDRPILARNPSPIGLLVGWARRHRTAVRASVLTLALAGSVSSALLWRENGRTLGALRVAETALGREREALRLTFAGSDLIASRALRKIAAGPPGAIDGPDAEFCRQALAHYERMASSYQADPGMVLLVAAAEHRVGFLRRVLHREGAEPRIDRAVRIYRAWTRANPSDQGTRKSLTEALDDLSGLVESTRGPGEAEAIRREALQVRRALAADFPGVSDYRLSVALTLGYRIVGLIDLGRTAEAESTRDELASGDDASLGLAPTDADRRNTLAWLLAARRGGSIAAYRRAEGLARRAVEIAPDDGRAWNTLGVAAYRAGDDFEAVRALEHSMSIRGGSDPYDWIFLALTVRRLGDRERAEALLSRSRAWIAGHGPVDRDLALFESEAVESRHD